VSFEVSDSCPDTDFIEQIKIHFTYKERWSDGSVQTTKTIWLDSIHPSSSHNTVIETPILTSHDVLDVYFDSIDL
jgi:hypothetical protein